MATFAESGSTKVKTAFTLVTPQMAMAWLEQNTHNRDISMSFVNTLARDMIMGQWVTTHQGIAIADDGRIIDGQHRLWAVVESKKSVLMLVTTGLAMSTQIAIDGQRARSTRDVVAIESGVRIESVVMGVARVLSIQLSTRNPSRQEQIRFWNQYGKTIIEARKMFPRMVKKVMTSHIISVITRAILCDENRDDLSRFCQLLVDGMLPAGAEEQPRDRVVKLLRNQLLENTLTRVDGYRKTERALRAFLEGDVIKTIYAAQIELFPLPNEPKQRLAKPGQPVLKNTHRRERGAQIPYPKKTPKSFLAANPHGQKSYRKFIEHAN